MPCMSSLCCQSPTCSGLLSIVAATATTACQGLGGTQDDTQSLSAQLLASNWGSAGSSSQQLHTFITWQDPLKEADLAAGRQHVYLQGDDPSLPCTLPLYIAFTGRHLLLAVAVDRRRCAIMLPGRPLLAAGAAGCLDTLC